MMIPPKLTHGDNFANLFEKFNTVIDYLREIRLVAGNGIRINRLPAGTTIESTATATGGSPRGAEQYRGGFMVSISESDGVREVHIHDYRDPEHAGFFTGSYSFAAYDEPLPGYGHYFAWARCEYPRGERFFKCEVWPDDYPIINQYNRQYVKLAEITSTETEFTVTQIFKDDRIDDSQMNFPYYLPSFMIDGTVTETAGGYQVSFRILGGTIDHQIAAEYVDGQNIDPPKSMSNIYLLYKRSSRGAQVKIYDKAAELHEAYSYLSEYRLQHIARITKTVSGYFVDQTFTGEIHTNSQTARSGSFDLHAVCEISEQDGKYGVVLTETVTGWILESFYPDTDTGQRRIRYNQNQYLSLPVLSGTFDGSNQHVYVALHYDPSSGQYSVEWTDHSTGDVYTWEYSVFSVDGTAEIGYLSWIPGAPVFQDGEFYVRDRWQ